MSKGRYALLVATGHYDAPSLQRLRSPTLDAEGLAAVLQDRRIGDFDVQTVADGRHDEVNRTIESFFRNRSREDILLLHISCHGIKNDDGELYFAARNTNPDLLDSTAVSAALLRTQMHRCRAKSIVVLLDCCYSGAFLPGIKGDTTVHATEMLSGSGRAVLTATNRFEYAWEGNRLNELNPQSSWFTSTIIEGLRTGHADRDRDGFVSVDELYAYIYEQLQASGVKQRPQRWSELEYQVLVARSAARTKPKSWPRQETDRPPHAVREATHVEPRQPPFQGAVPEVWGGVPRRNTRFAGRESLLNETRRLLQEAEPGMGVVALHGMPGVGKTQLAAEYVYRFGSEYDVVWWGQAEARVSYRRYLAELAPKLGLATGQEYGERLRAVRDSLRRGDPYARWLLVLDGADEPDQIWDLVPTGPGHVLITTRNPEWSEHNSRLLEVPVYERYESVAFIRRRAPRLSEAEANQLADALEDLPLLLDQTAGWLNDSDLSVNDYIALLEGGIDQDVVKVSADFPLAFQTTWSMLLNKLRETVPESVDLLRLCTFFAPGFIPVRLLREMPHDELPEHVAGLLSNPLLWNKAINQLRQYSVIRLGSDDVAASRESLYLHPMVHQIVGKDMPDQDRTELVKVVHQALAAADPGRPTDPNQWPMYAEIVPHLKYADVLNSTDPNIQRLVFNCLRYMLFSGEYAAGIKLGERALKTWRSLLGETHPRIWELTHHYANLLRSVGEYGRTEAIERAAVEHLREERGPQDLDHLRATGGLAAGLRGLGRYYDALELSQWLLTAYRELLGEQDSRTLKAQNNVAATLVLLGRYEEALEVDRRTLEAQRALLKARHPWTLYSETSYALDLRLLGRYAEAESVQTENVRELLMVLGENNPYTLSGRHNLAFCHYRSGDREPAGRLFADVLERSERVLGETNPDTLRYATSQSCFIREHGDIDQARELSEATVARYEVMLAEGHPYIAGARSNHSLILRSVGERDHAHALGKQVLTDMIAAVGERHPWTLGCAINASALRSLVGDLEAAAELSKSTVVRAAEVLGWTHPLTLSARVAQAADLRSLRDRQQAERLEQEALSDLVATLGPQHVHTISARRRNRPFWDFEPLMV